VHMPMDPSNRAASGVSATDFQEQREPEGSICFVCEVIGVGTGQVTGELLRPMTMFAGVLGGTQVFNRCRDRAGMLIKRRGIDLVGTRQFGFHKPGCSGS